MNDGIVPTVLDERLRFPDVLAPVPEGAAADHLLLASAREDDLVLVVTCPGKATFGDVLQLRVRGVDTGAEVAVDDYYPDGDVPLVLPAAQRTQEGPYALNYVAIYRSGGNPPEREIGPANQQFVVDYTPPGGDEPIAGLRFPDAVIADGVTAAHLVDDDAGDSYLAGLVGAYFGAAAGDTLRGYIDGVAATASVEVRVGEVGRDVPLRFYRSALEGAGDGVHRFAFDVGDRAGNRSTMARPISLVIRLKGPIPDLDPPRVPAANDGLVDDADARARGGVRVEIPGNTRYEAGDRILLQWMDFTLPAATVRPDDLGADPVHAFVVPYDAVYDAWAVASAQTDLAIETPTTYRVFRGDSPASEPVLPAVVPVNLFVPGGKDPDPETPEHEGLAPLSLTSASGRRNDIPAEDFGLPATLTIPWHDTATPTRAAFRAGDVLVASFAGESLPPYRVTDADESSALDLALAMDGEIVRRGGTGVMRAAYTATRTLDAGGENRAVSPPTSITVEDTWIAGGRSGFGLYYYANAADIAAIGTGDVRWHYAGHENDASAGPLHSDTRPDLPLIVTGLVQGHARTTTLRPRNVVGIFDYGNRDSGCITLDDGTVHGWGATARLPVPGLHEVAYVCTTRSAYAALHRDGTVTAWGDAAEGGSIPPGTAGRLVGVVRLVGSGRAFLAVRDDGTVVTWGHADAGGTVPPAIAARLVGVVDIASAEDAFAIRRDDGEVFCWGGADLWPYGMQVVGARGAVRLVATNRAFCALMPMRTPFAWGDPTQGGLIPPERLAELTDIQTLVSSSQAFAALRADGAVVAWGEPRFGGQSPTLPFRCMQVHGSTTAFAALSADGLIEAWGESAEGASIPGDIRAMSVVAGNASFAALTPERSVRAWGRNTGRYDSHDAVAVYAAGSVFVVLTSSGRVVAIGENAPDLAALAGRVTYTSAPPKGALAKEPRS